MKTYTFDPATKVRVYIAGNSGLDRCDSTADTVVVEDALNGGIASIVLKNNEQVTAEFSRNVAGWSTSVDDG